MRNYIPFCSFVLIVIYSCKQPDTVFTIGNVGADTSFVVSRSYNPVRPAYLWWRVVGNLDDSAMVMFKYPQEKDLKNAYKFTLLKENIKTPLNTRDYYYDKVEVVYKHQNVKKGNLTITVKDW